VLSVITPSPAATAAATVRRWNNNADVPFAPSLVKMGANGAPALLFSLMPKTRWWNACDWHSSMHSSETTTDVSAADVAREVVVGSSLGYNWME
jgi:hypothetical protein